MALPISLGFVPITAIANGADSWLVTGEVDDPTERSSGYDVAAGDIVFIDFVASTNAPGTVGRFVVAGVSSRATGLVSATLRWGGVGDPVDPLEGAGQRGYLTKPSARNGLGWQPDARTIMVSQRLIDAAKNVEAFAIVDLFGTGSGTGSGIDQVARDRQVRSVPTPRTFSLGQVVTTRPGVGALATPSTPELMPGIGIALGMGTGVVFVQTSGTVDGLPYTLRPGEPVFVSDSGWVTQDAAAVSRPGQLQLLGVAVDEHSLTLAPPTYSVHRA